MRHRIFTPARLGMLVAATALASGGIYWAEAGHAKASATPADNAVPVVVETIKPQTVRGWSDFSGRLQAVDAAEIRPEVSGRITEVRFEDGRQVKAGDVLFVIDPRPYEAAEAKAEAAVATARSNAKFAQIEQDRAASMMQSKAIAQRLYDERANTNRTAIASIQSAEAELKQAKIDLDRAYVKAPIDGRVGRPELTVGNLVQAGPNAPLLTSVVSDKSIYADFEVDEQTYIKTVRQGAKLAGDERHIPVELVLSGDNSHSYKGTIYSFDNHIDATSGTIRARAKFVNDDKALVPGMFVSVRLAGAGEKDAMLVPDRAIGFDQSKQYVYIVGADGNVAYREVELGKQIESEHIVTKGLNAGDRVVVDGVQQLKPGAKVAATELAAMEPAAGSPPVAQR